MFPFPSRKVTVYSPLSVEDAMAALRAAVGPRRSPTLKEAFLGIRGEFAFVGKVGDTTFGIERAITGRNSFLPILSGTVTQTPHGCAIAVTMRMHWTILIFMVFWVAMVGRATFTNPRGDSFFGVLMLAFALIMPHFGFWPEVKKAEAFLVETLQGEIENPAQ